MIKESYYYYYYKHAPQQKEQKQEEQRCEVCDEPLTLLDTYALSDSFEFIGAI